MTEQDKKQEATANPVELEESELKDASGGLNFTPDPILAGDGSVRPGVAVFGKISPSPRPA